MLKYESYPEAKSLIDEITTLVEKVEQEMGSIIAAQQIDEVSRDLQYPLKTLERALDEKNVNSIVQSRFELYLPVRLLPHCVEKGFWNWLCP